jgi:hypothetical protein
MVTSAAARQAAIKGTVETGKWSLLSVKRA